MAGTMFQHRPAGRDTTHMTREPRYVGRSQPPVETPHRASDSFGPRVVWIGCIVATRATSFVGRTDADGRVSTAPAAREATRNITDALSTTRY